VKKTKETFSARDVLEKPNEVILIKSELKGKNYLSED
jgi:hypothetical protein